MKRLHLLTLVLAVVLCACGPSHAQTVLIAAGADHTCALSGSGGVRCWGSNASGQLGNGSLTDSPLPVDVRGLGGEIVALAAGGRHTCALDTQGRVWCWGGNSDGQLGNGTLVDSPVAVEAASLEKDVVAISAGSRHTCVLSSLGHVSCWGANDSGQLGAGAKQHSSFPVAVAGLEGGLLAVAAGDAHTCALTAAGGVKCWGANAFGQLGNKTQKPSAAPVDVIGLPPGVTAIAAGGGHTCALTASGSVACWGWDGNETSGRYALKPENVPGLEKGVTALAAGSEHTCALLLGGVVKCWGSNYLGQLGSETLPASSAPVQINGLGPGVLAVAAGSFHTCVLSPAAGVQCWGQNDQEELGIPNRLYSATPVRVSGLKTAAMASLVVTAAPTKTPRPPTTVPWPLPAHLATLQPAQPVMLSWLHMLDAVAGWGIDTTGHVLRTADGGATWQSVTPPAGAYDARNFFAADASHAWAASLAVVAGSDGCGRTTNCHLAATVWQTSDGGSSWQDSQMWQPAQPLPRQPADLRADGPLSYSAHHQFFLDPLTGWFLLEDWGPDTDILTVLARTIDGGKSVREIWRDEGIGRYTGVVFTNKLVGYLGLDETTFFDRLSGIPPLQDYLVGMEAPYLLKTADGGRSWDVLHLPRLGPVPQDLQSLASSDEHMLCGIEQLLPIPPHGVGARVVCRVTNGHGPFSFYYLSSDDGATWHSWVASGSESFLDPFVGWRLSASGQFQQTADGGANWVTLKIMPWQNAFFDFVTDQSGWAIVTNSGAPTLMRTTDGGQHWTALYPLTR